MKFVFFRYQVSILFFFNLDELVKSHISPPLVGGDKGEGDISD